MNKRAIEPPKQSMVVISRVDAIKASLVRYLFYLLHSHKGLCLVSCNNSQCHQKKNQYKIEGQRSMWCPAEVGVPLRHQLVETLQKLRDKWEGERTINSYSIFTWCKSQTGLLLLYLTRIKKLQLWIYSECQHYVKLIIYIQQMGLHWV